VTKHAHFGGNPLRRLVDLLAVSIYARDLSCLSSPIPKTALGNAATKFWKRFKWPWPCQFAGGLSHI